MEGRVVAVGAGARDEAGKLVPLDVKVDDRVLFGKWSGTEVKLDGKELLIMKESDIMGIIEGQPAAKRKAACDEELRVNRPFAPQIYRRVVPITRDRDGRLQIDGQGPAVPREGEGKDLGGVAGQDARVLPGGDVPEPHGGGRAGG